MIVTFFVTTVFLALFGRIFGFDVGFSTGLSIINLFLGLSVAAIVASIASRSIHGFFPLSVFGPLWFGCGMAALSIIVIAVFSIYSGYSTVDAVVSLKNKLLDQILILTIGFFSIQSLRSGTILLRVLSMMVVSGCVLTIVDIFNIPDLGLITQREDGRVQGFIGSAEEFSTIVAATLPVLIVGLNWNSGYSKLLLYFSILVMVICLMLAATRGPIVGLIGAWLVYQLFLKRTNLMSLARSVTFFVPALAVVCLAIYYTPYWEIVTERFGTGLTTKNIEDISSGRSFIWQDIFMQMLQQPSSFIIGMGWDVYYQSVGIRFSAHNIFIDRFYALGFFGLVAYLFAYSSAIRLLFTPSPMNCDLGDSLRISAGLSLVVLLISAMFADVEEAEFVVYAFVGIGLRLSMLVEKNGNQPVLRSPANIMKVPDDGFHLNSSRFNRF